MFLHGEIKDLKKGTLYLERLIDTSFIAIDSIKLYGSGDFSFVKKLDSPEILHLQLKLENGELVDNRVSFFGENTDISLKTSLKEFDNAEVEGSENHKKLLEFFKIASRHNEKLLDLMVDIFNAEKEGDEALVENLLNERDAIIRRSYLSAINFAIYNKDYDVAPYVMVYETPDIHPKMLDTVYNSLNEKIKEGHYGKLLKERLDLAMK